MSVFFFFFFNVVSWEMAGNVSLGWLEEEESLTDNS